MAIFDFSLECRRAGELRKTVSSLKMSTGFYLSFLEVQHLTDMFAVNSAVRISVRIDNSMLVRTENRDVLIA